MKKRFLEAGRLNSPRGIKGELRFSCWCDSPYYIEGVEALYLDDKGEKKLEIALFRPQIPSIVFKGYEDRNSCAVLSGRTVWFDRTDPSLPQDAVYNDDLVGLPVFDYDTGAPVGTLVQIDESISGFLYRIKVESDYTVPAVDRYILRADPDTGIFVRLDEGLKTES